MSLPAIFDVLFAAGVVVAIAALAGAGLRLVDRRMLAAATGVDGVLAAAAWIALPFRHDRELLVTAGGMTIATLAAASSLPLWRALRRAARIDAELDRARAQLAGLVAAETTERQAELERVLARARADSISLLAEQERRIADERRALVVEHEHQAGAQLTETLSGMQQQVEQRLIDWGRDLERSAEALRTRLLALGQRQRQLIAEAEARTAVDSDRLKTQSDEQREALARLRAEMQRALEETLALSRSELDLQAADRRRALHELGERLRRRERELKEQLEREEGEALRRIQEGLGDVQRRQLEQLERSITRAASALSEEATQQFAGLVRSAREDAARRLSRELDRAVATFAREAEGALAEQLAHVGDAGAQRIERRLSQVTSGLERQRDEFVQAFENRLAEAEDELRRRLGELAADAEAERAILDARLQDLARRIDEAASLRAR